MIKNKILAITFLIFLTTGVNAQNPVWSEFEQIKAVQVMNNGGFMLFLDSKKTNACTMDGSNIILINPNHDEVALSGVKSLLSTALIAFTTDIKVKVLYSFSIESNYCQGKALYLSK